jgi:N-acetylmuramoyl-L-alanine amidase
LLTLAVLLSLLIGAVAGMVAYRYAATRGKPRTALPAPVAAPAVNNPPAAASQPAVRKIDFQQVDNNMQVTLVLDQPIAYDAHRLDHPDRVYLDLHGARLTPELSGRTVFVNKGAISDVRLAQSQPDTVRVVLDLEKRFDYSVTQQTQPVALVVKLTPHVPARRKRPASAGSQAPKTSPK